MIINSKPRKLTANQLSTLKRILGLPEYAGCVSDFQDGSMTPHRWRGLRNTLTSLDRAGLVDFQGYTFEITKAGLKRAKA